MKRAGVLFYEKIINQLPEPTTVLGQCKVRISKRLVKRLKQAPPAEIEKTFEQFFKEYQEIFPTDMLNDLGLKNIRKIARSLIKSPPL